ncbi:NAD-malate dehydrogenase [Armillaria mellea]|nr:NAD-malate dehydrogenase [Armillaria mellea]
MVKAVVLGAAGGIGQPLALLLKANPAVEGYLPPDDGLAKTLKGADVVVIPAGVPRKPGCTSRSTAGIVRDLATGIAKNSPKAFVLVISNPVNSTVPIVAEVLKKHGVFDPKRLFGVTTLDVVRASTFVGEITKSDSYKLTIVPLLSQSSHPLPSSFSATEIQFGGDEVVKAKDGAGSATLSMAYAGAEFANKVVRAIKGEKGIVAPTFIHLDAAAKKTLGCVKTILPLGELTDKEKGLVAAALPELKTSIEKGEKFITESTQKL